MYLMYNLGCFLKVVTVLNLPRAVYGINKIYVLAFGAGIPHWSSLKCIARTTASNIF